MRKVISLSLLPFSVLWRLAILPFSVRGRGRDRAILAVIFVFVLTAAFIDYPQIWNDAANRLNQKMDAAVQKIGGEKLAWRVGISQFPTAFFGRTLEEFTLGLDVQGGVQMIYDIDSSTVAQGDKEEALQALRDAIERRVNFFGVREPNVILERSPGVDRLIVELAGVSDPAEALAIVQEAPFLEFREEGEAPDPQDPYFGFVATGLTGQHLKRADVVFDPNTNEPQVSVTFNDAGKDIFAELTRKNLNKRIGIFLDGNLVSAPEVQQEIPSGQAVITGFIDPQTGAPSIDIAKEIARNLNAGALPMRINLVSQQQVGAALGQEVLARTIFAGIIGFLAVVLFMLIVYRFPGVLASLALVFYAILFIALFKLIPVTLTLAGIAGVILSIGMAVDANILIFARMREEMASGKTLSAAIDEGFMRAWTSIFDSNMSTILTSVILYLVGTSFVRGFALALGVGVILSMFTAVFVSRRLLREFSRFRYLTVPWLW